MGKHEEYTRLYGVASNGLKEVVTAINATIDPLGKVHHGLSELCDQAVVMDPSLWNVGTSSSSSASGKL